MLDVTALRSLLAVDRLGSVAAAAGSLGYTPSAVSQQIKKLEAQSGVLLLERFGRGVMLTEAGRLLVGRADELLRQMEEITSGLHADSGVVTGRLRVATFATACRGLVAGALAQLHDTAPGLDVSLVDAEPWDGVDLVASGQVDLAVVHNWEPIPLTVPVHVDSRLLGTDRADVLVHRGHPLASRSWVRPRDLAGERWVSVSEGSICHQWLTWMLHDVGVEPQIAYYATEFASHIDLVAHGVATALVPRLGRGRLPREVVAVAVREPVPTRLVTALSRRTMSSSPTLQAGLTALNDVARTVLES